MFHELFFLYAEVPNNNHDDEGNFAWAYLVSAT